jgi:hypothetical protein
MIEWLQGELKHSPEILLFLSLAIGFLDWSISIR